MKIFWSWQSDTHQPSNRYFVRDVLGNLAKTLNGVDDAAEESDRPVGTEEDGEDEGAETDDDFVSVDHDTKGLGGSPRIAERILEKIAAAAVFVADVTPVAEVPGGKHVPNPNVMIELGYALHVLGEERIVLVGNRAFNAKLSRLPFDLRHRSAPAFYTLRPDATEERKAEVAAELMDDLRDRIAPGLKLALKQLREDARRTRRVPELSVIVEREADDPFLISQTPQRNGVKTLDEIRAENPPLRFPTSPISGAAHGIIASQRGLSGLGMGGRVRQPSQWTSEETETYNRSVQQYYRRYDAFLDEHDEHSKLLLRTFQVQLAVKNSGTSPATGIDVDIYFPDWIMLWDHDEAPPSAPEAPEPPAKVIVDNERNYGRIVQARPLWSDLIPKGIYNRHTTLIYPEERRVRFSEIALKHHTYASLEPIIVTLATEQDVTSFDAKYVITANEPIDPIKGEVHFDVRLVDGKAT
ncbi:MAG: hypothetical protein CL949_02795 [Erythrobacter sp.]|nr:hypothetical protein [Erythrobacter sp.]